MPPIKRSAELQPLSRDHHRALLVAMRVQHGLDGKPFAGPMVGFDGLLAEANEFYSAHFTDHAAAEEEHLVPALRSANPDAAEHLDRLVDDHRRLSRLLVEAGEQGRSTNERRSALCEFGAVLEAHVRFEERELFAIIEESLAHDVLEAIGERLAEYEAQRDPSCRGGGAG